MKSYYNNKQQPMSLLIRNLAESTSPAMVREKFKKYGAIKDVYLPIDYYTKEPKGFGFVEFYNPSDAEQALKEMNGLELDGNKIDVFVAQRGRSNPKSMKYKDRNEPYNKFSNRRYYNNKISKRYISKSNSRYDSYTRDKMARRSRSRDHQPYRYKDNYVRRNHYGGDRKSFEGRGYNRNRNRHYERDGYSPMRRTSRDYRVSSPKYRDRRRHDRYSRSNSRRSSRNRYEHRSKRSRRDNSSYNRSRHNESQEDDYSDDNKRSISKHSRSKRSNSKGISKSLSFNSDISLNNKRRNDDKDDLNEERSEKGHSHDRRSNASSEAKKHSGTDNEYGST
ncbi:serine/arginine-rich splicing factor 12 [Hepatocystis sp. ex Piliocolobus tephrosceles]|nr:serine/arginine-rich splicing factor 12 [Hepatocystis sp. ex Piliocolobus tephrosceles]